MTSPTSTNSTQFQNYSLSSQYGTSSSSSLSGFQNSHSNTPVSILNSGSSSVSSSMGGVNNTSPLNAYTGIKSPVTVTGQTPSQFTTSKPSVTKVFSPTSITRNNLPASTLGSNVPVTQATSYSSYMGSNITNPPSQANFWRKH